MKHRLNSEIKTSLFQESRRKAIIIPNYYPQLLSPTYVCGGKKGRINHFYILFKLKLSPEKSKNENQNPEI